jgi:hypothetical protein
VVLVVLGVLGVVLGVCVVLVVGVGVIFGVCVLIVVIVGVVQFSKKFFGIYGADVELSKKPKGILKKVGSRTLGSWWIGLGLGRKLCCFVVGLTLIFVGFVGFAGFIGLEGLVVVGFVDFKVVVVGFTVVVVGFFRVMVVCFVGFKAVVVGFRLLVVGFRVLFVGFFRVVVVGVTLGKISDKQFFQTLTHFLRLALLHTNLSRYTTSKVSAQLS